MGRKQIAGKVNCFLVLFFIIIPVIFSSCLGHAQTNSSGISGIVLIGPISPIVKEGEVNESPYPDALILILDSSGKKIMEVKSNKDGHFTTDLPPGKYILDPQTPGDRILPVGESQEVPVLEKAFTDVTIYYDSGIR